MDKNKLISMVESQKPKDVKMLDDYSKEDLIKNLLEGSFPGQATMMKADKEGKLISLGTKKEKAEPSIKVAKVANVKIDDEKEDEIPEDEEKKPEEAPVPDSDKGIGPPDEQAEMPEPPDDPKAEEPSPEKEPDPPSDDSSVTDLIEDEGKKNEAMNDPTLRIDADTFGIRTIIVNKGLLDLNMNDYEKSSVKDIFTPDELNMVLANDKSVKKFSRGKPVLPTWRKVGVTPSYGAISESGKTVFTINPVTKKKFKYSGEKYVQFLTALYDPKDKTVVQHEYEGEMLDVVPFEPRYKDSGIAVLYLHKNKSAISIISPETKNVHLFSMTPKAIGQFFTKR